jgi:sodium/hydrogen exchanger 8
MLSLVWPKLVNCRWVHSFAAGVDALRSFIDDHLLPLGEKVTLTNGRGAFSSSLAEHALAGMLYFNKQISRCERNRKAKIWDNFVMDTMDKKTVDP